MEEQGHPAGQPYRPNDDQPSRRGGKLKWAAIGGAVFLVLVVAAGAAGYFLIPGIRASEPEGTAVYFPDDVLAYSWATLSPGVGQGQHMLDIWERFNEISEFQDAIDELLEEFEDDTGIDFEEDVLPGSARIYPLLCWTQVTLTSWMPPQFSAYRTTGPLQTSWKTGSNTWRTRKGRVSRKILPAASISGPMKARNNSMPCPMIGSYSPPPRMPWTRSWTGFPGMRGLPGG